MNTSTFESLGELFRLSQELRDRLSEARSNLTDEEFEAAYEGPFADILCAVMDLESALEQCENS